MKIEILIKITRFYCYVPDFSSDSSSSMIEVKKPDFQLLTLKESILTISMIMLHIS